MVRTPLELLRHHVTGAIERGEAMPITEQRWISVTDGPSRLEVNLYEFLQPIVVTLCVRRDTGTEYTRTLKPQSQNWKRAVRLARRIA